MEENKNQLHDIKQSSGNPCICVFLFFPFHARLLKSVNNQKHLNHFFKEPTVFMSDSVREGQARQSGSLVVKRGERMEGERGGCEEERCVLYPEQSI